MGSKPKPPKETAAERAYADIGVERMEMARKMRPIREDLFRRVADFRKQSHQMRNQSATDFAVAAKPIKEAAARTGDAGTSATQGLALAKSGAGAAAATEQRVDKARLAGLQGLADLAVEESGEAIAGMGELAAMGHQDAVSRARMAAAKRNANAELVAAGLGAAGAMAYGTSGGTDRTSAMPPGSTPLSNPSMNASFSDQRLLTQPGLFGG